MTIATLVLELIPLVNFFLIIFVLYQAWRLQKAIIATQKSTDEKYQVAIKRIEALEPQAQAISSPNEAMKKPEKTQVLDENVPWDIPKDVKIAVEGGDTNVPPDFEV